VLLSHYGPEQGERLLRAGREALTRSGFLVFDFLNEAARSRHAHRPENKHYFTPESACLLAHRAGFGTTSILGGEERRISLLLAENR
jgi:hypothetical protein